jgi:hypothetical protein
MFPCIDHIGFQKPCLHGQQQVRGWGDTMLLIKDEGSTIVLAVDNQELKLFVR